MRTCGMICVPPYAVEEHSGVSKTGCRRMGLQRCGIGTEMKPCERLLWHGVRHMVFHTRHKATCILPRFSACHPLPRAYGISTPDPYTNDDTRLHDTA